MAFDANTYLPGTIAVPSAMPITAITNARQMVVSVDPNGLSEVNTYVEGQSVRLTVPFGYGMFQADGLQGRIINVSGNDITLDIDSRQFDSFSVPVSGQKPASIAPNGSQNLELSNNQRRVPFQSYNNVGN